MDLVLNRLYGTKFFVCLDDIVNYATSLEEHDKKCTVSVNRLSNPRCKSQLDKCEFLRPKTRYLGSAGYYRKCIKAFLKIAAPLNK